MNTQRFSHEELYALRNQIPVAILIEKVLGIPTRTSEGVFRFLCPLCNGYNTAVNPKTNLARCFGCQKNFNTIDLVMVVKKTNFVNTIRFLENYRTSMPTHSEPELVKEGSHHPQHLGDILNSIVPSQPDIRAFDINQNLHQRILTIEQKLEYLTHQIEEINKPSNKA
ncbi:MAG: DNA primase [Deltaproteobacteria bacterium]|nr:DNA primase [Deltaproteobacteria bacterium]